MSLKHILLILAIPVIAVAGYGFMHWLVIELSPVHDNDTAAQVIASIAIPVLGLLVPYLMLKLGFFEAHLHNHNEKNIYMRDIPMDKSQLSERKAREV